jgi:hypothetical protein
MFLELLKTVKRGLFGEPKIFFRTRRDRRILVWFRF